MKKDATRMTVEKTIKQIQMVRKKMKDLYAFGPNSVRMEKREARRMIQNMSPEQYDSFFASMGKDKWDVLMKDLYS